MMHDVLTPYPNCQGKHSSDEEDLDDVPDDDQYDTEDSFIDDAELVSHLNLFCLYLDEFVFVAFGSILISSLCLLNLTPQMT
jgi:hypothetical protein